MRPTERQMREHEVEAALREHDLSVMDGECTAYCCVLAAEVRALREELDEGQKQLRIARASIDRLEAIVRSTDYKDIYAEALEIGKTFGAPALVAAKATIARVEALSDAWRDAARSVNDPRSPSIFVECAEELEKALRGEHE